MGIVDSGSRLRRQGCVVDADTLKAATPPTVARAEAKRWQDRSDRHTGTLLGSRVTKTAELMRAVCADSIGAREGESAPFDRPDTWQQPIFPDLVQLCRASAGRTIHDPFSWTPRHCSKEVFAMAKTHEPYAQEYRQQMVELVRAGRSAASVFG